MISLFAEIVPFSFSWTIVRRHYLGLPHQSVGVAVIESFHHILHSGPHLLRVRVASVDNLGQKQ